MGKNKGKGRGKSRGEKTVGKKEREDWGREGKESIWGK